MVILPKTFVSPEVLTLIEGASQKWALDFWTLVAHVEKESSGNPLAVRLEVNYRWFYPPGTLPTELEDDELMFQKSSWGLLQIMGATARDLGYCEPAMNWPASPLKNDPATALDLGCQYLLKQIHRWGDMRDALSAYNAGHPNPKNFEVYAEAILERADALKEAAS